jgi:hypothetical protein
MWRYLNFLPVYMGVKLFSLPFWDSPLLLGQPRTFGNFLQVSICGYYGLIDLLGQTQFFLILMHLSQIA